MDSHPAIIPAMTSAIMHSVEKKGDRVIPTTPVVKKRLKTLLNQLLDFTAAMSKYGLDEGHNPHDGRKTFITKCKNAGVNEYAINDIIESVYTDRPKTFLIDELSKVSK